MLQEAVFGKYADLTMIIRNENELRNKSNLITEYHKYNI